jgi:hypothetical protein
VLSIAGTLASKGGVPISAGTLPTHGMQSVALLVSTIVIVSASRVMLEEGENARLRFFAIGMLQPKAEING